MRLALALQFLTRLPIPARWEDDQSLARAAWCFPIVGSLIGGAAAAAASAAGLVELPTPLPAVAALVVGYALTGPLHLDGLADVADGLAAGPDRQRMLKAMADPAIGSAGASALVLHLIVRVCLVDAAWRLLGPAALIAAAAVARWAAVVLPAVVPYAHREPPRHGGMSACWFGQLGPARQLMSAASVTLIAWLAIGSAGLLAVCAAAIATIALGWRLKWHIGGATGDALGAAVELGESAALLLLVALVSAGWHARWFATPLTPWLP